MVSKQEKGGHARAAALSTEEKKAIARNAAMTRWDGQTPRSTHEGDFMLGDVQVSAAVLPNRQRLITQATFLRALGRSRSPKAGTGVLATVDGVPFFLQAEALKPFITNDLLMSTTPVFFIDKSGRKLVGYDARMLPHVADVYLKFRDQLAKDGKAIPERYQKIIAACDVLVRYLAIRGILSLVDRATGYTEDLEREVVAQMLETWISDKLRPYVSVFPVAWFKEICRLKGVEFKPNMKLPPYFGKIVNDLTYDRLGFGVRQWLDERTPVGSDGRRRHKKHQHLTAEYGVNELKYQLGYQVGLMANFGDGQWKAFYDKLNRTMPPFKKLPLFDVQAETPKALPSTAGSPTGADAPGG